MNQIAESLLPDIEIWLKAVFYILDPAAYAKKSDQGKFTLNPLVKELGLLSELESQKDIDSYQKIPDPVRQKILLAYRFRNTHSHEPRDYLTDDYDPF